MQSMARIAPFFETPFPRLSDMISDRWSQVRILIPSIGGYRVEVASQGWKDGLESCQAEALIDRLNLSHRIPFQFFETGFVKLALGNQSPILEERLVHRLVAVNDLRTKLLPVGPLQIEIGTCSCAKISGRLENSIGISMDV